VEAFPRLASEAPQADRGRAVDRSTPSDRQVAWAAGEAVGDALTRWWNTLGGLQGVGLRGGTFDVEGPYLSLRPLVLHVHGVRFVEDVAVSGRVEWRRRAGMLTAVLRVRGPDGTGRLRIVSPTDRFGDEATLRGVLGGRRIDLTMPRLWSS
jgi:hypothetical protein